MAIEKTDYATGEWIMLFESDYTGRPDSYWCIEQDPDGYLCVTSNAETRRRVDADRHRGASEADEAELRSAFEESNVPSDLIDRYMEQAGF